MKTRFKRLGALLLAFVTALSLLPVSALAAATVDSTDGSSYRFWSDGTLEIFGDDFDPSGFTGAAGVTTVHITEDVKETIGNGAAYFNADFSGYTALERFVVDDGNPLFSARDGVLYMRNGSILTLMCYPAAKSGSSYVVPDDVTDIRNTAFSDVSGITLYVSEELAANCSAKPSIAALVKAMETHVTGVSLAPQTLTLDTSEAHRYASLTAVAEPVDATDKELLWSSSDTSVVTVDQSGNVTAVGAGDASVTVTTVDGGYTAACGVTVLVPVTALTIEGQSADVDELAVPVNAAPEDGEAATALRVVIDGAATNRTVTFRSDSPSVALLSVGSGSAEEVTVTADGAGLASVDVVPLASGAAHVTATAGDESRTFALTLSKWVKVGGVALVPPTLALNAGETFDLAKTVDPADADVTAVSWESDLPRVAEVDQTGKVTAVAPGDAVITVSVTTGGRTESAVCAVSVAVPVTGVTLDAHALTLKLSGNVFGQLAATVAPEEATDKTLTWSSSDETVATVDQTGKVTAVGKGSASITAKSNDPTVDCADTCVVTVEVLASGVALDQETLTLEKKATASLTATVSPDFTSDARVTWESSDTAVATVENGVVTAKDVGTATITVTTADGSGRSAECAVTRSFPSRPRNFCNRRRTPRSWWTRRAS